MGETTGISWCDSTFNPWRGCEKVSPGCANCYAESQAKRNPATLGVWGSQGTRVLASESMWRQPYIWDHDAAKAGVRRRVFCASMADVFESWGGQMRNHRGELLWVARTDERLAPRLPENRSGQFLPHEEFEPYTLDVARDRLLRVIRDTPNLDWLLLTKRPESILPTFCRLDVCDVAETFPNMWLGVSVENQKAANERIPSLLNVPCAVRFLSCEPLLGPVDLEAVQYQGDTKYSLDVLGGTYREGPNGKGGTPFFAGLANFGRIRWVIVGGESGPRARPMSPEWARWIRDECNAAGVAFFFKQWGEPREMGCGLESSPYYQAGLRVGEKNGGDVLDGRRWQEFPTVRA